MTTTYGTSTGSAAGVGARVALTLLGAAGLIVGAFMEWTGSIDGTKLDIQRALDDELPHHGDVRRHRGVRDDRGRARGDRRVGDGTGWLTRLAGAVAVVGFILFAIEVYRSSADEMIGVGAWIALAGGIVTLIAGFFGPRHTITAPTNTVIVDE